jgi:hypothetical protein
MTLIYLLRHRPTGYAYAGKRKSLGSDSWPRRGTGFLPDGYKGSGHAWANILAKYPNRDDYEWIVLGRPSEETWADAERRAIRLVRHIWGPLCVNIADGGEGQTSEAAKAISARPEVKAKQKASLERRYADPAFKAKSIAAMRRVWDDPAIRAKHKAAMQRLKNDPAHRAKMKASKERMANDPLLLTKPLRHTGRINPRPIQSVPHNEARRDCVRAHPGVTGQGLINIGLAKAMDCITYDIRTGFLELAPM